MRLIQPCIHPCSSGFLSLCICMISSFVHPCGRRPSRARRRRLVQVMQRRPSRSNKDDLQGQIKTTSKVKQKRPSRLKTTIQVRRRRPSWPNKDDLPGQTKTTFAAGKDDFRAKRRRPSPHRKTTFYFSYRLPMHLGFQPIKSDWAQVCTPKQHPRPRHFPTNGTAWPAPSPKHDNWYSTGLRSHLFGVVSGQPLGTCHQLQ